MQPKLQEAVHVIAYVDRPNANVGYEIGYALGRGNRNPEVKPAVVALALHAKEVPGWLKNPPFAGFNAVQFEDENALIDIISNRGGFPGVNERVTPGADLLFLCPKSGGKFLKAARELRKWRELKGSGWALKELPQQLQGVGAVVWMIPPTADDERDGPENTALSVVAGFAEACGIEMQVLLHSEAREVLDLVPKVTRIRGLEEFTKIIAKVHDDLVDRIQKGKRSASQPVVAQDVSRPDVGDLPTLPHTEELKERFIGRQRWLEDYYAALEGLRERWTGSLPVGGNPVQIFWYHGLGGMGKTTLVRKAMFDTGERYPQAKVAYWEWDKNVWRKPLDRPPDSPEDLFVAVAYRLAQLYGIEALDPYWRVEARIKSAASQAKQAKSRFHNEHNEWLVKGQASSALRSALDALGCCAPRGSCLKTSAPAFFDAGLSREDSNSKIRRRAWTARVCSARR